MYRLLMEQVGTKIGLFRSSFGLLCMCVCVCESTASRNVCDAVETINGIRSRIFVRCWKIIPWDVQRTPIWTMLLHRRRRRGSSLESLKTQRAVLDGIQFSRYTTTIATTHIIYQIIICLSILARNTRNMDVGVLKESNRKWLRFHNIDWKLNIAETRNGT